MDQIIDSLTRLANPDDEEDYISPRKETNKISLKIGKVQQENEEKPEEMTKRSSVLILGAGRVCRPAAEFLASVRNISSQQWYKTYLGGEQRDVRVIVASLYLKDAKEVYTKLIFSSVIIIFFFFFFAEVIKYVVDG